MCDTCCAHVRGPLSDPRNRFRDTDGAQLVDRTGGGVAEDGSDEDGLPDRVTEALREESRDTVRDMIRGGGGVDKITI